MLLRRSLGEKRRFGGLGEVSRWGGCIELRSEERGLRGGFGCRVLGGGLSVLRQVGRLLELILCGGRLGTVADLFLFRQ